MQAILHNWRLGFLSLKMQFRPLRSCSLTFEIWMRQALSWVSPIPQRLWQLEKLQILLRCLKIITGSPLWSASAQLKGLSTLWLSLKTRKYCRTEYQLTTIYIRQQVSDLLLSASMSSLMMTLTCTSCSRSLSLQPDIQLKKAVRFYIYSSQIGIRTGLWQCEVW